MGRVFLAAATAAALTLAACTEREGDTGQRGEAPATQPAPPAGQPAAPAKPPAAQPMPPGQPTPPAPPAAAAPEPAPATASLDVGRQLYETNCLSCHGAQGRGDGPVGQGLDPRPRSFASEAFKFDADGDGTAGTPEDLRLVVANGAAQYGGSPLMAPWGHLGEEQIAAVVAYVQSLRQR
jgi:mono/diheme cytochrome c family protein